MEEIALYDQICTNVSHFVLFIPQAMESTLFIAKMRRKLQTEILIAEMAIDKLTRFLLIQEVVEVKKRAI
jgi:hypothetical protein